MMHRFSQFVVDVWNFCESRYAKIHIAYVVRKNLLQYEVHFVRI